LDLPDHHQISPAGLTDDSDFPNLDHDSSVPLILDSDLLDLLDQIPSTELGDDSDFPDTDHSSVVPADDSDLTDLHYEPTNEPIFIGSGSESDDEVCSWTGGVNYQPSDHDLTDGSEYSDDDSERYLEDLNDQELVQHLECEVQAEIALLQNQTVFEQLQRKATDSEWKKAESNRALGYNGQSDRTHRRKNKEARDGEEEQIKSKDLYVFLILFILLF
jgi:hypothetical protein